MPTILIYDLNETGRESIRQALHHRREWDLVCASTSQQVVNRLENGPVDLVVAGAQALQRNGLPIPESQQADASPHVPIIVLTGAANQPSTDVEALLLDGARYTPCSTGAHNLVVTAERILTLVESRRRHARLAEVRETTETAFTLEDNNLDLVFVLARHLAAMCEEFGVCRNATRRQTAIALERAMRNGIVHGNLEVPVSMQDWDDDELHQLVGSRRQQAPWRDRKLFVHGRFTPGEAQFALRAEGPGFKAEDRPGPVDAGNLATPYGRGLLLIRQFMDEVSFNEQGNILRLVKRAPVKSSRQPDTIAN